MFLIGCISRRLTTGLSFDQSHIARLRVVPIEQEEITNTIYESQGAFEITSHMIARLIAQDGLLVIPEVFHLSQ
jgi:hypothetical protein